MNIKESAQTDFTIKLDKEQKDALMEKWEICTKIKFGHRGYFEENMMVALENFCFAATTNRE